MSTKIHIPTPLRPFTGKQDVVEVDGATVGELLGAPHVEVRGAEEASLQRRRQAAQLRQHLRERRGHPVPAEGSDAGEAGRHAQHHPVGRRRQRRRRDAELPSLDAEEIQRYSRHLILPEVGMEGQRKLKAAQVLCIGAGGLGSPVALYLAAAGVGTLGIVDFDVVDFSNLQRQILHGTTDVGRPKLAVGAAIACTALNPNVQRRDATRRRSRRRTRSTSSSGYDVIVDGTDNFPTRYLVNDACVLLGKPNVYGSIFRFEGQASVFGTKEGPCYRCLYPEPPPPGLVPSCAEGGVLGVLPGIIG